MLKLEIELVFRAVAALATPRGSSASALASEWASEGRTNGGRTKFDDVVGSRAVFMPFDLQEMSQCFSFSFPLILQLLFGLWKETKNHLLSCILAETYMAAWLGLN